MGLGANLAFVLFIIIMRQCSIPCKVNTQCCVSLISLLYTVKPFIKYHTIILVESLDLVKIMCQWKKKQTWFNFSKKDKKIPATIKKGYFHSINYYLNCFWFLAYLSITWSRWAIIVITLCLSYIVNILLQAPYCSKPLGQ
jgi:hypothetical protein